MQIKQFVQANELPASLYDRPYFVAPKGEAQSKAMNIMRKALEQTDKLGGEIAFSGREHLAAFGAPQDPKQEGTDALSSPI
jgi:DNA end-binding protein Ku